MQHYSTKTYQDISETHSDHSVKTYVNLDKRCLKSGIAIKDIVFRGAHPTHAIKQLQEENARSRIKLTLEAETNQRRQDMKESAQKSTMDLERKQQIHKIEMKRLTREEEEKTNEARRLATKAIDDQKLMYYKGLVDAGLSLTEYMVAETKAKSPNGRDPDYKLQIVGDEDANTHIHLPSN